MENCYGVIADLHFGENRQMNNCRVDLVDIYFCSLPSRICLVAKALDLIVGKMASEGVEWVIIAGDVFHAKDNKKTPNEIILVRDIFNYITKQHNVKFVLIDGNHDLGKYGEFSYLPMLESTNVIPVSRYARRSVNLTRFDELLSIVAGHPKSYTSRTIDFETSTGKQMSAPVVSVGKKFCLIPSLPDDVFLEALAMANADIVIAHQLISGVKVNGHELVGVEQKSISKVSSSCSAEVLHVIAGDVHKRQVIEKKNFVWNYVGAPCHHTFSDCGNPVGGMIVYPESNEITFVENEWGPFFVDEGSEIPAYTDMSGVSEQPFWFLRLRRNEVSIDVVESMKIPKDRVRWTYGEESVDMDYVTEEEATEDLAEDVAAYTTAVSSDHELAANLSTGKQLLKLPVSR